MTAAGQPGDGSFAHLHVHTEYSMLDGAARLKDLFDQCERTGMTAIAMTDHGNVYGAYDFWSKATGGRGQAVIGIEAYVAPEHRRHRQPVRWGTPAQKDDDVSGAGAYTHMTLLAETTEGMHNLFRLSSLASLEGYFRKPRMDRELLAGLRQGDHRHHRLPVRRGPDQAPARPGATRRWRRPPTYRDIFGPDNFFVEIMDHGLPIEQRVRDGLRRIAQRAVAAVRGHQRLPLQPRRATRPRTRCCCACRPAPTSPTPSRFKFDGTGYYLKSPQEMRARAAPTRNGRRAATPPCSSPSGPTSASPRRT